MKKWTKEMPKLRRGNNYILLTASFIQRRWEHDSYLIEWETSEDFAYWALLDMDGVEWGDITEFSADMYCLIPQFTGEKP